MTQVIKVNMESQMSKKINNERKKKQSHNRIDLSEKRMSNGKVNVRNII